MANRFPLIVDTSDSNKIKELPSGDNLQLSGNSIVGVESITASGTIAAATINATNITQSGTPLANVATTGNYLDLSNRPTNISSFTNDSNYISSGANVSTFVNDAGYLTTVAFADLTGKPTTIAGYGITDAATSSQGTLADSAIQPGDNISTLNNDSGYVTLAQVQSGDITIDVNNSGDLYGSVFGQDSTVLVDSITSSINLDGTIRGHVTPFQSEFWDLGSFSNRFRDAYINGQVKTTNIYSQDDTDLTIAGASIDDTLQGNSVVLIGGANTGTGNGGDVTITGGTSASGTDGKVIFTGDVDFTNAGTVDFTSTSVLLNTITSGVTAPGSAVVAGNTEINFNFSGVGSKLKVEQDAITIGSGVTVSGFVGNVTGDVTGSVFADDSTLLVDAVNSEIPGYVKIADLKTALQDGAGDYAAFKAWVLANL